MKRKSKKRKMSQARLADVLGVTRRTVGRYKKLKGAPPLDNVDGWVEFLAEHGQRSETTVPPEIKQAIRRVKLSILKTRDEREKMELAVSRGDAITMGELEREMSRIILHKFWGHFDRLSEELPEKAVGTSPEAIRAVLNRASAILKRNLVEAINVFRKERGKPLLPVPPVPEKVRLSNASDHRAPLSPREKVRAEVLKKFNRVKDIEPTEAKWLWAEYLFPRNEDGTPVKGATTLIDIGFNTSVEVTWAQIQSRDSEALKFKHHDRPYTGTFENPTFL